MTDTNSNRNNLFASIALLVVGELLSVTAYFSMRNDMPAVVFVCIWIVGTGLVATGVVGIVRYRRELKQTS